MPLISIESVIVQGVAVQLFTFVCCIFLACILTKSLFSASNDGTIQDHWRGSVIIVNVLSLAILAIHYIIIDYFTYKATGSTDSNPYDAKLKITGIAAEIPMWSYLMSLSYFLRKQLEDLYRDMPIYAVGKGFRIFWWIYALTLSAWTILMTFVFNLSYFYPALADPSLQLSFDIITDAFILINLGYFGIILVVFNRKMFKYIRNSIGIDAQKSDTLNRKFFLHVTRQTNLISLIILAVFCYAPCYVLHWIFFAKNNLVTLIYYYVSLAPLFASLCCFLTFKSNIYLYNKWCRCCHSFWIRVCTKCGDNKYTSSFMSDSGQSLLSVNNDDQNSQRFMDLLKMHYTQCVIGDDDGSKILDYLDENGYNIKDISNDFYHLSLYHSPDFLFENRKECSVHPRNFSTKRRRIRDSRKKRLQLENSYTHHTDEDLKIGRAHV